MSISTGLLTGNRLHRHFGVLCRFAQFFVAPLFNPLGTDREMRAVDAEHRKNINDDNRRMHQIFCRASNPLHPYSRFTTGCLETLQGKTGLRERLLAFHEQYYSANLMRLVVYGREELDRLAEWASDLFGQVPSRQALPPKWPEDVPVWTAEQRKTAIYLKTVTDRLDLHLRWIVPDQRPHYRTAPSDYVCHFLGHEGPSSLLAFLKARGWATALSASCSAYYELAFLTCTVSLSDEGLAAHRQVILAVHSYIRLLRERRAERHAWDEHAKISGLRFWWQDPAAPASRTTTLAHDMHLYAPSHILTGSSVPDQFAAEPINELLDALQVSNFRYMLACRRWSEDDLLHLQWQTDHWYSAEYAVQPLSSAFIGELEGVEVYAAFALPAPNKFIPTSFAVLQPTPSPVHTVSGTTE